MWSAGVISRNAVLRNCLLEVVSKEVDPEGRHDGADRAGSGGLSAGGGEGAGGGSPGPGLVLLEIKQLHSIVGDKPSQS